MYYFLESMKNIMPKNCKPIKNCGFTHNREIDFSVQNQNFSARMVVEVTKIKMLINKMMERKFIR